MYQLNVYKHELLLYYEILEQSTSGYSYCLSVGEPMKSNAISETTKPNSLTCVVEKLIGLILKLTI